MNATSQTLYYNTENTSRWAMEENSTVLFDPGGSTSLMTTDKSVKHDSGMSEDWKVVLIVCGVEVFFYLVTLSIIYVLRKVRDRW